MGNIFKRYTKKSLTHEQFKKMQTLTELKLQKASDSDSDDEDLSEDQQKMVDQLKAMMDNQSSDSDSDDSEPEDERAREILDLLKERMG